MDYERSKKILKLVFILFVLVLLVYVVSDNRKQTAEPAANKEQENQQSDNSQNVKVVKTDLSDIKTESQKLPEGFPSAVIPVETETIVESYVVTYEDNGSTQYTVVYLTAKSADDKYNEYKSFMEKEIYIIREGGGSSSRTLYG